MLSVIGRRKGRKHHSGEDGVRGRGGEKEEAVAQNREKKGVIKKRQIDAGERLAL